MIALQKYQNKKIAIYGMGITGCSAAKIFKNLKAKVFCWDDSKKIRKKIKNLKFPINKFWLNQKLIDAIPEGKLEDIKRHLESKGVKIN